MRIGEEVFAIHPRRQWGDTPDNEKNGPDGGSRRRSNDAMCVLAKHAIRVPGTIRMEMQ